MSWLIREAKPDELNFVYATWLNSYYADSYLGKSCRKTIFYQEYPSIIDAILNRPLTKIIIAELESVILSYLVFEPKILHYLFTKEIYRKQGVAKSLYKKAFDDKAPLAFTHTTREGESFLTSRPELTFNPFKLYQQLGDKDD